MVYKWYILPIGGLYNPYHLLGEPETAIDWLHTFSKRIIISEIRSAESLRQTHCQTISVPHSLRLETSFRRTFL